MHSMKIATHVKFCQTVGVSFILFVTRVKHFIKMLKDVGMTVPKRRYSICRQMQ